MSPQDPTPERGDDPRKPRSVEDRVIAWRRYGHWRSSARKTRFSAFLLWTLCADPSLASLASACNHQGSDFGLGVIEAYRRESALALELVVKAVIADRLRAEGSSSRVPATHDVPQLWSQAKLPKLSSADLRLLHLAKSVLEWSGRYAAPLSAEAWEEENRALGALLDPPRAPGRFVFREAKFWGVEWQDLDRLYQMAAKRLSA